MRLKKYLLVIIIFWAIPITVCAARDVEDSLNIHGQEFFLENGMQFLVVERHTTPQVAFRLAIRAGSALETSGHTGIAHMLEHMMFKGTKNFGTLDYKKDQALQAKIEAAYEMILEEEQKRHPDRGFIEEKRAEMEALRLQVQKIYVSQAFSSQVGKNGAVGVNAFTTKDQTQYIMSIPSDMMEQWFSIVSEQLFEPSWREFYVEKAVVQREWAFRYVNNPAGAAWLDLDAAAYTAHPYRNPVIGWKSDMDRFSTEDAIAFHKKYYNPTNAVCVLVGDITVEEAKRLAKIYFDRYPAGRRSPAQVTAEPVQEGPRESIRYLKGARTPLVRIGFPGARMGTDDFYALDAMTMILSHGIGSRMTQNIVNKGLAPGAWAYNPDNRYGGRVVLGGSPNEPPELKKEVLPEDKQRQLYLEACEELEDILLGEIEKLKIEKVSPRDLERIKKLNRRDFLDRMRSNESVAGTLASIEVQVGWEYLTTYLNKISAVTADDIQRVANTYIRTDAKTSVYILPGGKPDRPPENYTEVRSIGGSGADKIVKPEAYANHSIYPTPTDWKHPLSFSRKPEKITYPDAEATTLGDTRMFYLPDRELPLVDLSFHVKAGSVDVDKTRIGLADILDKVLIRGGTETYSPGELAMVLDENAVRLSVSIGEEASTVRLSVMKGDWEIGLELLKEVLTKPRFDPAVFNVVKMQELTALKRQGEDAHAVAMRESLIWEFKGHPYGRDPLLGLETIPGITVKDLKDFLRTFFVPSNMVIAVSGDIEKARAESGIKKLLDALPQTDAPERRLEAPAESPPVLAFVHKPGQVQSQVALGLRSVERTHPAFWKMSLLVNIFGGGDSLMYRRLRDDLGLVYAAYFYQTFKWKAGMLVGYIGCKGDKTGDAITETLSIMEKLHQNVPETSFGLKRLDTLNSFVFNVDTPSELVDVYSRYYLRKEPLDTLERIQQAYMETSREELERLAGRYLVPKKAYIVVVGDRSIPVRRNGSVKTLEADLKALADRLGMPYKEIALR
jgi:predicted Zn-dependent peptidase